MNPAAAAEWAWTQPIDMASDRPLHRLVLVAIATRGPLSDDDLVVLSGADVASLIHTVIVDLVARGLVERDTSGLLVPVLP